MTIDDIEQTIARITRVCLGDPEAAHCEEDDLYVDTLAAIADGAENPKELALAALQARSIDYTRWYA